MRKQEHVWEMQKAATMNRYLEDIAKQAMTKVRKEKLQKEIKECLLYCFPKIRNYAADLKYGAAAADEVREFFEKVCDGTYNFDNAQNIIECVHHAKVLSQHYEHFDAEGGEATKATQKAESLETKLKADYAGKQGQKRKENSPHSLSEVSHFREQMEGFY